MKYIVIAFAFLYSNSCFSQSNISQVISKMCIYNLEDWQKIYEEVHMQYLGSDTITAYEIQYMKRDSLFEKDQNKKFCEVYVFLIENRIFKRQSLYRNFRRAKHRLHYVDGPCSFLYDCSLFKDFGDVSCKHSKMSDSVIYQNEMWNKISETEYVRVYKRNIVIDRFESQYLGRKYNNQFSPFYHKKNKIEIVQPSHVISSSYVDETGIFDSHGKHSFHDCENYR